ncbi:MAG: DUF3108 domain-containing protein [Syntrophobacterales bacterium]|nr:DUF3108 domain-containing protein [Syntrophobacterales bacterium]
MPSQPSPAVSGGKLLVLALLLTVLLGWPTVAPSGAAPAPSGSPQILEDLKYRVDLWIFNDSVPARVVLSRLGGNHYRASISGQAKGILALLSGHFKGEYSTDMLFTGGRFRPLLYREKTERRGKLHVTEHRFDHEARRVEVWKWDRGKRAMVKKWEGPLDDSLTDPLSFYYNQRLRLGEIKEGEVVRLPTVPYPKPEEVVFRVGPLTPEGRRVTIILDDKLLETEGREVQALLDQEGVATRAWAKFLRYGQVSGTLLPESRRLKVQELLAAPGGTPGPTRLARRF